MIRYLLMVFFLMVFPQFSGGQQVEERNLVRFITGELYGGQLQIHSSKIEHFRGVQPIGIGMDFSWKFISAKAYELCRCYPSLGVSFNYWDLGHEALGNAFSSLFYVEPVLFSPFDVSLSLKAGLGVSFLDNPYDEENNPENIVYSTSIAFPLMAGLSVDYPVSDDWSFQLSAMFQHISNGGVNQPNLGINYTTIGLGVSRKLDRQKVPPSQTVESFDASVGEKGLKSTIIAGLKEPEGSESKASVIG